MKKYINIILIFAAVLLSACTEWLDLEPEDGVIRQEYWQTKEHVNAAVIGCYASMQNGPVEKMFLWGELRADMLENGVIINPSYSEILDGEISSSNYVVDWSDFYTVINNCNVVLEFAPQVMAIDGTFTEKQLNEYKSEALTIRALMYFYLVRSFKDVPLIMKAYISDDQDMYLPKTDGNVILDTLINDLKFAINYAPSEYPSTAENKSRFTRWSARALLADIYLWKEQYTQCNVLCDEIIGSGKFSMMPVEKVITPVESGGVIIDTVTVANESDVDNLFNRTYVNGNSVESLFELPYTSLKNNPFYSLLGPLVNRLQPKLDNMYDGIFPAPVYSLYQDASDVRGSNFSFRLGVVWKYVGTGRTAAARTVNEYTTPWILYKYSDVLLMKAEALNQIGNHLSGEIVQDYYQQAINSMKIVRDARNAVETSDYKFEKNNVDGKNLEKAIFDERGREFTYEGKRWYDVLRYAKRDNYDGTNLNYLINLAYRSALPTKQLSLIAKYKDPKHNSHYWPIYINEIETNKNLTQNEFYAN